MSYEEKLFSIQKKYDNLTRLLKDMIDPKHPIYSQSVNYMVLTLFFVQIGILLEGFLSEVVSLSSLVLPNHYFEKPKHFWLSFLEAQNEIKSREDFFTKKVLDDRVLVFQERRLRLLFDLDEPTAKNIAELIQSIQKKRNRYAHAKEEGERINWIRLEQADAIQEETLEGKHFQAQQEEIGQVLQDFDTLRRVLLRQLKDKIVIYSNQKQEAS
jgi:hypothetical protein